MGGEPLRHARLTAEAPLPPEQLQEGHPGEAGASTR